MAKKVVGMVKLQVSAGQANPSPPVGPALGPHGVNIMEFCKAFNAQTQNMEKGAPIPVVITAYADRSFTLRFAPVALIPRRRIALQKEWLDYLANAINSLGSPSPLSTK